MNIFEWVQAYLYGCVWGGVGNTQREDETNTSSIWSLQRNCYSYNNDLLKHENKGSFTWRRQRLLRHCCWSFARGYITTIFVYNLSRLRTSNVDRANKRKWLILKRHEADNLLQILKQANTTQIILCLLKIHKPELIPHCIAKSKQQQAFTSSWT